MEIGLLSISSRIVAEHSVYYVHSRCTQKDNRRAVADVRNEMARRVEGANKTVEANLVEMTGVRERVVVQRQSLSGASCLLVVSVTNNESNTTPRGSALRDKTETETGPRRASRRASRRCSRHEVRAVCWQPTDCVRGLPYGIA